MESTPVVRVNLYEPSADDTREILDFAKQCTTEEGSAPPGSPASSSEGGGVDGGVWARRARRARAELAEQRSRSAARDAASGAALAAERRRSAALYAALAATDGGLERLEARCASRIDAIDDCRALRRRVVDAEYERDALCGIPPLALGYPKNSSKFSLAVKSNSFPTILGPFVLAP